MKTKILKTGRNLFLVTALISISVLVNAQDIKLNRQERKEVEKADLAWNFYVLDSLFNTKSFVLEADYLQDKYGFRVPVPQNLNFIKVNDARGIIQTGNSFSMGSNGVGGVTAEGSLRYWKINKNDKRMSYTVRFNLATNIGFFDVFLSVNAANNAQATISGLGPGKLTWVGHIVTVDNSRVFKGTVII